MRRRKTGSTSMSEQNLGSATLLFLYLYLFYLFSLWVKIYASSKNLLFSIHFRLRFLRIFFLINIKVNLDSKLDCINGRAWVYCRWLQDLDKETEHVTQMNGALAYLQVRLWFRFRLDPGVLIGSGSVL